MAVKDVRYRSMICDICGAEEQFEPSVPCPNGWWALRFAKDGLTIHSFDTCPECNKAIFSVVKDAANKGGVF